MFTVKNLWKFFFTIYKMHKARVKMKIVLFLIPYIISALLGVESQKVSIWGPGLEPDKIVMPARYFFVKYEPENNKR